MSPAAQGLLELAEAERLLVEDDPAGRVDELAELQDRRDELIASLPSPLTDEDRAAVQRAMEVQVASTARLQVARDAVLEELRRVGQGRRVAQGYTPTGMVPAGSLDLRG